MGGNATDGCGEFMPSGDEGTLEALTWLRLPVATGISIGKKPKVGPPLTILILIIIIEWGGKCTWAIAIWARTTTVR
ncbi:zinc-finger homeodomain protein 4 [Phtheirospermum japonicum]|uniref:Zinc-finger homeodomain protein 4 n=1 Tax=Phtheirospermum japonicum TaxID=374723 RepID=A0A830B547_9LAMI|nr:zinc-finger homeodomain protein 4 [Phtheirospermum japonicum]